MRRFIGNVSVACMLCMPGVATAQPREVDEEHAERLGTPRPVPHFGPVFVELGGGFGAPVGLLGATLGLSPARWLTFAFGGGLADDGLHLAVVTTYEVPVSRALGIGLELSASGGPYAYEPCGLDLYGGTGCRSIEWDFAVFGYAGMFIRYHHGGRWWTRVYFGNARVLNPRDATCGGVACEAAPTRRGRFVADTELVFVGVGFGYVL